MFHVSRPIGEPRGGWSILSVLAEAGRGGDLRFQSRGVVMALLAEVNRVTFMSAGISNGWGVVTVRGCGQVITPR